MTRRRKNKSAGSSRASSPSRRHPMPPPPIAERIPWEERSKAQKRMDKKRSEEDIYDITLDTDDSFSNPPTPPQTATTTTSAFIPFRPMTRNLNLSLLEVDDEVGKASKSGDGKGAETSQPLPPPPPDGTPPPPPLLLPEHITIGGGDDGDNGDVVSEDDGVDGEDMDGIAILNNDNRTKGLIRYYDPEATDDFFASADLGKVCRNCKKPGHREFDCTTLICLRCGQEGHERNDCPFGQTCRYCGQSGHPDRMCKQRAVQKQEHGSTVCMLCGSHGHGATGCELAWRTYVYYPPDVRRDVLRRKDEATSWELEAIGGDPSCVYCYNCAQMGHFGDQCPKPFGSRAPIRNYPSAFSTAMAGRGPYGATFAHPLPAKPNTHTKWVDDQPEVERGFAGFGGANAGKRGRENQKAKQRELDRRRSDDDRDDWFSNRNNDGRRGRSDRDNWRDRPQQQQGGWKREHSPPRGGPRGSLASRITGMSNSETRRYTPYHHSSSSAGGYRERRGEAELEERQWRASGAGGGRVDSWGPEMDREDRRNSYRDDRPRAGPSRGGGGGGGGGGRGGRGGGARGQRYSGGYY